MLYQNQSSPIRTKSSPYTGSESRRFKRNKPATDYSGYNLEGDYFTLFKTSAHRPSLSISSSCSLISSASSDVPDLSDSCSVTDTSDYPITPTKPSVATLPGQNGIPFGDHKFVFSENDVSFLQELDNSAYDCVSPMQIDVEPVSVFDIPELVYKIISFADLQASLCLESAVKKPKYSHVQSQSSKQSKLPSVLSTCLQVNKLFYQVTKDILTERLCFKNQHLFERFAETNSSGLNSARPSSLKLNSLYHAKQHTLNTISERIDSSRLNTLEFFMCPKLTPPIAFFSSNLISLSVAGSRVVDDSLLNNIALCCPKLKDLDLRACDLITDSGIYAIASNCKNLVKVNLGRKRKGHLISDNSTALLVRNNPYLETVGFAGCAITDVTIWELALNCGRSLRRLSINGCHGVTDSSISKVFSHNYVPELSVFEMRDVPGIKNYALIVNFKRHQALRGVIMWIESSEETALHLKECERKLDLLILKLIRRDIHMWVHEGDDDKSYIELLRERGKLRSDR